MPQRYTAWLIPIVILIALAAYVVWPNNPGIHFNLGSTSVDRDFTVHEGLDLQGGLQVLMEADLPAGATIDNRAMNVAKQIVEQRVNALGVTEPVVQRQGERRIVIELPGITDPQQAIETIKQTGLLEFVDLGTQPLTADTAVRTDCSDPSKVDCGNPNGIVPTPTAGLTSEPTSAATSTSTEATAATTNAPTPTATATGPTYHTVMTGVALKDAIVTSQTGEVVINFTLTPEGTKIFGDFTTQHTGQYLAIVLDKKVLSAPVIRQAITSGTGTISGNFTIESANRLALQLRYGSLPIPLKVVQSREIGPTLGEDSVRKSAIAGAIGLVSVVLFMLLYYRLPGAIADIALIIYAILTFALFKFIPVTLTLPGIAGFVLSVGVAVDANILIFERMKEELRAGRNLRNAVDTGFSRAWPSIRDSNAATLITCGILFFFGNTFGASIVKGFAVTLALGVAVSLFTAILVTRSILHLFLDRIDFSEKHSWFGI
jgi:preprotein translocase subunit SecD